MPYDDLTVRSDIESFGLPDCFCDLADDVDELNVITIKKAVQTMAFLMCRLYTTLVVT
jgi:hypothetical protein